MKNILLALLGFMVALAPLPATAQFIYTTNNGTITITGYNGLGGAVTIPSIINGLPVTSISSQAFQNNSILTSVMIPSSVTSMGFWTFRSCSNLTNVTISGSITSLRGADFYDCISLTSVTILNGVTRIGGQEFGDCASLISVTIPNTVTILEEEAFYNCISLTNIAIPASVTSISSDTFRDCTNLMAFTVDAANAYYSSLDGVLLNKGQLTLVLFPGGKAGTYLIPSSVTNIGAEAFLDCTLSSISIPGSVTSIGDFAFTHCISLTNVTILNGVSSIGYSTFSECSSLTNVTIPSSVSIIWDQAFGHCTNLQGVFFQGNAPGFGSYVFYKSTNATVYYLSGAGGDWFTGVPAVLWNPLMQSSGVGPAGFSFNITGTADIPIVIEAATNTAGPTWVPLQSLNLTNGAFYFSDPDWTNYPTRSYRIRSP